MGAVCTRTRGPPTANGCNLSCSAVHAGAQPGRAGCSAAKPPRSLSEPTTSSSLLSPAAPDTHARMLRHVHPLVGAHVRCQLGDFASALHLRGAPAHSNTASVPACSLSATARMVTGLRHLPRRYNCATPGRAPRPSRTPSTSPGVRVRCDRVRTRRRSSGGAGTRGAAVPRDTCGAAAPHVCRRTAAALPAHERHSWPWRARWGPTETRKVARGTEHGTARQVRGPLRLLAMPAGRTQT